MSSCDDIADINEFDESDGESDDDSCDSACKEKWKGCSLSKYMNFRIIIYVRMLKKHLQHSYSLRKWHINSENYR